MNTSLEIDLGFFPLAFFLFACTPVIEINGKKHERSWGKCKFELDAARYDVKIYFPYIFMSECGANTVTINLETGDQKKISYYMWPWMFSKGSISVK
jgi:hypothetical protein